MHDRWTRVSRHFERRKGHEWMWVNMHNIETPHLCDTVCTRHREAWPNVLLPENRPRRPSTSSGLARRGQMTWDPDELPHPLADALYSTPESIGLPLWDHSHP